MTKEKKGKQGQGKTSPQKSLQTAYWVIGVLSVILVIISSLIIGYGQKFSSALFSATLGLTGVVVVVILAIHKKGKDYSHPLWVVSLGLITTFIGFTLSGSVQEIMKDREEKHKLNQSLLLLQTELTIQKRGLEETIGDFYTVLFDASDGENQSKRFYVSKEPSVYSKSDTKSKILSELDLVGANQSTFELNEQMLSVGTVSEIYDGLTFQSNDPQEMLESYLEVISLHYEVRKQINTVSAQFEYLNGTSWKKIKRDIEEDEQSFKEETIAAINKQIKLAAKKYPNVHIEMDPERLID